jgi:L-alanine-DL-glutamate epimerase-like enolase superfamily enzyme
VKIKSLELREIHSAFNKGFSGSTYSVLSRRALLIRITTDEGAVSEICVGNEDKYSDSLKSLITDRFRSALVGADPLLIEQHWLEMLKSSHGYVDRADVMKAIATVDTALWDLRGQITGQPLWKLLGGYTPRVAVIGIGGYYETSRDAAGIRDEIEFYKRTGLGGIKFKVGALTIEEDAERVRLAREAGGAAFNIVVDSNMAWNPADATAFAKMIKPYNPDWLEEPVHWQNVVKGLHDVRLASGVRTGAGQSETSVFDCYKLLAGGAVDVLNMTYNRGGGVTAWAKLAGAASLVDVRMGQVAEPHVSMHLMAGFSNATYVECYPDKDRDPFWDDLYLNRPEAKDGYLHVTNAPGIGLKLNPESVEKYAVEAWH